MRYEVKDNETRGKEDDTHRKKDEVWGKVKWDTRERIIRYEEIKYEIHGKKIWDTMKIKMRKY